MLSSCDWNMGFRLCLDTQPVYDQILSSLQQVISFYVREEVSAMVTLIYLRQLASV